MLDRYGRSGGGSPDVAAFTKSLLSTTKNVMSGGDKSGDDSSMDKLYDAVNAVAMKIDSSASEELNQAIQHTSGVSQLYRELRSLNQANKDASKEDKTQGVNLKNLEKHMGKLLSEAQKQNTLWVGVSKFGTRGYKQIVQAIREALGKGSGTSRASASLGASVGGGGGRGRGRGRGVPVAITPSGSGSKTPGGGAGGGGRSAGGAASGGAGAIGGMGPAAWSGILTSLSAVVFQLARIGDSLMSTLDLNLDQVFDGLIKDENIFKENMRQIVYQTQGLTGANRELEKSAFDIDNIVMRTGYNRSEFQKLWLENMQRGFKIQNAGEAKEMKTAKGRKKLMDRHVRDMKNITIQALHTSKQTGMSADNLNDMFQTMQFGMGMTSNQVHIVARGMKSIARDMGLTGDNLAKAMANAQKLLQKMADAGTLTAEAADGVNRMMAAASKHGVENFANSIIEATGGSMESWLASSDQTKNLLFRAAGNQGLNVSDVRSGKQMSTEAGQRQLLTGVSNVLSDTFMSLGGGDSQGLGLRRMGVSQEAIDNKDLSSIMQQLNELGRSDVVERLSLSFKRQLGVDVGEASRAITAIQERTMSHAQRMGKMQEELQDAQRRGSISAQREIQARMAGAQADMFVRVGRNMSDLQKDGATGAELQEKLAKRMAGHFMAAGDSQEEGLRKAREYVSNMGAESQNAMGGLQTRIDQINKQGGNADLGNIFQKIGPDLGFNSMEGLRKAMASGDQDAFAAYDAIDQAISDEERALSDPMTAMRKDLHQINEMLRSWSQGFLGSISKNMLWLVAISSKILMLLASITGIGYAIRGISSLFGGGGGGFFKGMTTAFTKGFGRARAGGQGILGATARGGRSALMGATRGGVGRGAAFGGKGITVRGLASTPGQIVSGISGIFEKFKTWFGALFARLPKIITELPKIITGRVRSVFRPITTLLTKAGGIGLKAGGGIGKLISKPITTLLTKVGGKSGVISKGVTKVGLKAGMGAGRAAAAGSTAGLALAVFAVIDGAMGAWDGYKNTAKNFAGALKNADGSMSEATMGMTAASTASGALTGILDGLTLGLLDMFGIAEPLEKFLSWIFYAVIHPFEMIWEGLKEGFMEAWGQIKPSFDIVWDAFKSIGDIFDDLFKDIGEMFGMGDIEGSMDYFIKMWEMTGPIFKEIGSAIGWVLGRALVMVIPPILWFIEILKDVFNIISGIVKFVAGIIGIIYNLGAMIFGFFTGNEDMVNQALDGLIAAMKGVLEGLGQLIWGALKGIFDLTIGWIIAKIAAIIMFLTGVDIFTPIYDAIDGVKEWFYDLYIWLVGGSLIPDLINGIWEWMKKLPGIFLDALLALPGIILEGIAKLGGAIIDGLIWAISGVGGLLLEGLDAVFSDFPMWLWEQVKAGFAQIGEWILDIIPGLRSAVKGFSETAEEQAATRAEEGNSLAHAGGGFVGAASQLLQGNVGEATGKAWESTKEVGGAVWDGAKAVGSAINPLNWFEQGTRKIASDGVAMLHQGEMVVPESVWSQIAAAGSGPFGSGGSLWSGISDFLMNPLGITDALMNPLGIMDALMNPLGIMDAVGSSGGGVISSGSEKSKPTMSLEDMLVAIVESLKTLVSVNTAILGAFTGDPVSEAMSEAAKGTLDTASKELKDGKDSKAGMTKDVLDTANKELKNGLVKGVNESITSVVEGSKESEKQFGMKQLMTFIAKDIGRIRESLTGEYSAMSDALMGASNSSTSEKVVESAAKELGALDSGEVGAAQEAATQAKIANLWGADKYKSASDKFEQGDIAGGALDFGRGFIDQALGPMDEILGSAYDINADYLRASIDGISGVLGFGESSTKDLGAFSEKETKEASELGTMALTAVGMNGDSPLAGTLMPGNGTGIGGTGDLGAGINGHLQSIDSNVFSIAVGMYELLNQAVGKISGSDLNNTSTSMMGAFDSKETTEANEFGTNSILNGFNSNSNLGLASGNGNTTNGDASATNLGAFEKFQAQNDSMSYEEHAIAKQYGMGVNELHRLAQALQGDTVYNNPDTSLAKSMYYDSMGGEENDFWKWITQNNLADVSSNPMDYTDSIKGQVTPRMMSDQQLENAVASRLMGQQVSNSSDEEKVSGPDNSDLFKMMVHFLKVIAENTTPEQFKQIVGSTKFGVPPARQTGIKKIATDNASGFWNLQAGSNSGGTVSTDGRGSK